MSATSDRAFIRSFALVLAALAGIAVVCGIIAAIITRGVDSHPEVQQALAAQRLTPVAKVVTDPKALMTAASDSAKPELTGEQVVSQVCSACHQAGMLGAPKIGDNAEWSKRFKTQGGLDGLVGHAIKGLNQMPPRGGNPALTDKEIHEAVKYMLGKSGVST